MTRPATARRAPALTGAVRVPGDKSVSHRALMLGALAVGRTVVRGLLEGDDVHATARAVRAFGAGAGRREPGHWCVDGRGVGGLAEPDDVVDMGNAGTGARLFLGIAASHPVFSVFTGDASLRGRPMARVTGPLGDMGARFTGRAGGRLPLAVEGTDALLPGEHTLSVASAQVKSALLLAGLNTGGRTTVVEPAPTRDHTERLLRRFGAAVTTADAGGGARAVSVEGWPELEGQTIDVPADPSSAAFPLVAALIVPDSRVTLRAVGLNPLRAGLFDTLREMGAAIEEHDRREEAGEPVADLTVTASTLRGIAVPADRVPAMIDEYPVLAVAAACAAGTTRMHGLGELRVKESDRLAAIAEGLDACGVAVAVEGDTLTVHGTGRPPAGGATVATLFDHRIAMAFLVLGLATEAPVRIDDTSAIATSFPGFAALMNGLGAAIESAEEGA